MGARNRQPLARGKGVHREVESEGSQRQSHAPRKHALHQYITGWVQYFKLADMQSLLIRVDEWYRRRLRMVIWKQWKQIKTRLRNLIRLGINKYKAYEWANTRKGYWRIAGSFILNRSITSAKLREAGYVFFSDCYRKVKVVY